MRRGTLMNSKPLCILIRQKVGRRNVIFSSAIHGYSFGVEEFAEIYTERLSIPKAQLAEDMFGDFYFSGGKIKDEAAARGKKTLFVQLVLEPLWALHDCGLRRRLIQRVWLKPWLHKRSVFSVHVSGKLGVTIKSKRILDAFDEAMRTWLPLPQACFRACARAPSARSAFKNNHRMQYLIGNKSDHPLAKAVQECSPEGITVALVVKFVLKEGAEAIKVTVGSVWTLRGRDLLPLNLATAGVICAIDAQGLLQNATLCSEPVSEGLDVGIK
ncbi:unnamed protein product, partial [Cylicostephanus goldi]